MTTCVRALNAALLMRLRTRREGRRRGICVYYPEWHAQLIADAKGNVINGKISQEAYDTHMRMISEIAKISLFGRK